MKYLHIIHSSNTTTLSELDAAVFNFIDKFEMRPDLITMHHSSLKELYEGTYHNQNSTLLYKENGDMLIRTYVGIVKLKATIGINEKMTISDGSAYILVENVEASKVDDILLGDNETVDNRRSASKNN